MNKNKINKNKWLKVSIGDRKVGTLPASHGRI